MIRPLLPQCLLLSLGDVALGPLKVKLQKKVRLRLRLKVRLRLRLNPLLPDAQLVANKRRTPNPSSICVLIFLIILIARYAFMQNALGRSTVAVP